MERGREGTEREGDDTPPLHAPRIHICGYAPDLLQIAASKSFAKI